MVYTQFFYFFLFILKIFYDLAIYIVYKRSKFSKSLSKKNFNFVLYKQTNFNLLNFNLLLLLTKVDSVFKKQYYKENILVICGIKYIKMIFALLTKVAIFYIQVFII